MFSCVSGTLSESVAQHLPDWPYSLATSLCSLKIGSYGSHQSSQLLSNRKNQTSIQWGFCVLPGPWAIPNLTWNNLVTSHRHVIESQGAVKEPFRQNPADVHCESPRLRFVPSLSCFPTQLLTVCFLLPNVPVPKNLNLPTHQQPGSEIELSSLLEALCEMLPHHAWCVKGKTNAL